MKKIFIITIFVFLVMSLILSVYMLLQQNQKLDSLEQTIQKQEKIIFELKKEIASSTEKSELHPIEKAEQDCMKKENYTTAAMLNCVEISIDEWTIETEKYYNNLMNILPKQQQLLLIDSQKKWNEYKKIQWELNKRTLCKKVGSMYVTICIGNDADLVKNRAQELESLYYFLTE